MDEGSVLPRKNQESLILTTLHLIETTLVHTTHATKGLATLSSALAIFQVVLVKTVLQKRMAGDGFDFLPNTFSSQQLTKWLFEELLDKKKTLCRVFLPHFVFNTLKGQGDGQSVLDGNRSQRIKVGWH